MVIASLSSVFTPQFHYYSTPQCAIFDQLRVSTPCCNFRHAFASANFNLQRRTALATTECRSSKELIGECKFNPSKVLANVSAIDKQIKELTSKGFHDDAVKLYIDFLNNGLGTSDFHSFPVLVKAVGGLGVLKLCWQIHGHLLKLGVIKDVYVANSFLSALWKVHAIDDVIGMFEVMELRDSVSWSTMISGFCQSRLYTWSLEWFRRMLWESESYPNRVACLSALSSCASVKSPICGQEIHAFVIKIGLDVDAFVLSGLLDMYMKCGYVGSAEQLFEIIAENARENTVLWSVMILGYGDNGYFLKALECFIKMTMTGIQPDTSTMVALLILCSDSSNLAVGEQIHAIIIKAGLDKDVRVGTSLIDMYFNCDNPECALKLFDRSDNYNLVTLGTVISNCARSGYPRKALDVYVVGLKNGFLDSVTLLAALRACSSLALKSEGMVIHGMAVKLGFDHDTYVGSALVDMYAKCKDIVSAQSAFLGLSEKDEVSWSSLISGYAQNECWDDAVKAFCEMHHHQIKPNAVLIASILSMCARVFTNLRCKEIHGYVIRHGFETNVLVNNSLIVTYAKCGNLRNARRVFLGMDNKDEVSWNSIMLGLGQHGHVDEVFGLFENMKETGLKPDHQTFTAVLAACSHTGRVAEGLKYFRSMTEEHMLKPNLEQYTCLVDLLGRAGYLSQAYDLITAMPYPPDDRVWGSLLGSCRNHGDERLAEVVANHIFELDSSSIGYRVLLANLYEDSGKWSQVDKHRSRIKDMGLKKSPGCSWIDVNSQIHVFTASDQSHYQAEYIYSILGSLTMEMKRVGYVPQL